MTRIFAITLALALFASCDSSIKEDPQNSTSELEALIRAQWGERRAVLITSVPEYHALFEWESSGQLSNTYQWGSASEDYFLTKYVRMQIKARAKWGRRDSYRTMAVADCTMKKGSSWSGLGEFADCIEYVIESCDTVYYTDSEDGETLEAHGVNVTFNPDGSATLVPCNPPDPWKA